MGAPSPIPTSSGRAIHARKARKMKKANTTKNRFEYYYTNAHGMRRQIVISLNDVNEEGIASSIWDMRTGDMVSCQRNSREELVHFLAGYGIKADF